MRMRAKPRGVHSVHTRPQSKLCGLGGSSAAASGLRPSPPPLSLPPPSLEKINNFPTNFCSKRLVICETLVYNISYVIMRVFAR